MFRTTVYCLVILCLPLTVVGQNSGKQEKLRYVLVPPERALLAVASQPACPLQIDNARLLYNVEAKEPYGRIHYGYEFRNRGSKPIAGFTVVAWTNYGTGGTLTNSWGEKGEPLLPGQGVTYSEEENRQIIPLTEELRGRLKLSGPMQAITILMVERVHFADGTVYEDEKVSKALLKSLEFWEVHPGETPEP